MMTTKNQHAGTMSVATLKSAHESQESGRTIGKTVLEGFK